MGEARPVRLRFTSPALQDLDQILDYIWERSPSGTQKVQVRLKQVFDLLVSFPKAGSPTDDPEIRRIVVLPHPYLIFYQCAEDEVIVHAVRHAKRDPS